MWFFCRVITIVHIEGLSNPTQSVRKTSVLPQTPFYLMSGSSGYRPEVVIFIIGIIFYVPNF